MPLLSPSLCHQRKFSSSFQNNSASFFSPGFLAILPDVTSRDTPVSPRSSSFHLRSTTNEVLFLFFYLDHHRFSIPRLKISRSLEEIGSRADSSNKCFYNPIEYRRYSWPRNRWAKKDFYLAPWTGDIGRNGNFAPTSFPAAHFPLSGT